MKPTPSRLQKAFQEREKHVELLRPFLEPQKYDVKTIEKCRKQLKKMARKEGVMLRQRIFTTLRKLGMEPFDARKTELGAIVPDMLPQRTIKDAWRIVIENQGLIGAAGERIGKFRTLPEEDVKQVIAIWMFNIALWWNEEQARFSTYLFSTLKGCKYQLKLMQGLIRFKPHDLQEMEKYQRFKGRHPHFSTEKIAEMLEIPLSKAMKLERWIKMRESSMDPIDIGVIAYSLPPAFTTRDTAKRTRETVAIMDVPPEIALKMRETPEQEAIAHKHAETTKRVLGSLTRRERKVMELRFGVGEPDQEERTIEQIGFDFETTRERIRQIEAKALHRLRHPSRAVLLRHYR